MAVHTASKSTTNHEPGTEEREAYRELLGMAQGRTGKIPADLLVRHVLTVTADGDWPVQDAAIQAVLRRFASIRSDELQIASRPARRRVLGTYRTRRKRSPERPYDTMIAGVDPIGASCNCADYIRNSLGLCKHALCILDHLHQRPRLLKQAQQAQSAGLPLATPTLLWDPIRPLRGDDEWLARVLYIPGADAARNNGGHNVRDRFVEGPGDTMKLRTSFADDPHARLALVGELLDAIRPTASRRRAAVATVPALPPLLTAEKKRLRELLLGELAAQQVKRAVAKMKLKPYQYQREGVDRLLAGGRLLLADDMGLGKTAQAITSCHVLWDAGQVRRGLLIVPASLKPQWQREWRAFSDAPIILVDGNAKERHALYHKRQQGFLVTSYEQFLRDFAAASKWAPEIVILDEAQRIKNWATKSARLVKQLDPRYRLVLSGTPMENRLEELASIYDWVESHALEPKWRLVPAHVTPVDGDKGIGGARNLDTLRARLAPTMLRRTRQEVLDQLPARTDTNIPVEITHPQAEEHAALDIPIAQLMAIRNRRPLRQSEFLRLMQLLTTQRIIANGMAQYRFTDLWPGLAGSPPEAGLLESLSTPKLLELVDLLEHVVIGQQRKVVIFSQWRRMLELAGWATAELLARAGKRAVFFTGRESQKRRTQNLVELHDEPSVSVLFASDAGGVGLNLQKAANCCINLDLPWNPAVLEQRIGRIYRLGQKRPIDVYNLITQDSIEERIAHLIADKKALFSSLFDGSSNEMQFERSGTFLSTLERVIEPVQTEEPTTAEGFAEEDTFITREIEEMTAAADEADDEVVEQPQPRERPPAVAMTPRTIDSTPFSPAHEFHRMFEQVEIRRSKDGTMSIEAPPEAAETLAAVFEGLATLLRSKSQ